MDRDIWGETVDTNKTGKFIRGVHDLVLDDNDSRKMLKSIVKSYNALIIFT